ncbi:MAG: hypothetical protein HFG80_00315 [Eubacterium sp.]|nr:hypothetical protein [Eubacterium sp.]
MVERNNIFQKDIDLPEIVHKKADEAFFTILEERNLRMENMEKQEQGMEIQKLHGRISGKKAVKTLVAAAACAAVVITAAGSLTGPFRGILGNSGTGAANPSGNETGDAFSTAMGQAENMFTLQVKAAETQDGQAVSLEEGKPVPVAVSDDKSDSWVLGADDTRGSILDYCINIPQLICQGENIQSITYSINNGALQVVQPENEVSIIIDGQPYGGTLNTGSIGGDYSEERDGQPSRPFETVLYKSITLDYNRQSDEYTWINICNERHNSREIIQSIWKDGATVEEYNGGLKKMLDPTMITCTVHYKDNTSKSAVIKVDSEIMTRREAGEQPDSGMNPKELEEKTPVITFELQ